MKTISGLPRELTTSSLYDPSLDDPILDEVENSLLEIRYLLDNKELPPTEPVFRVASLRSIVLVILTMYVLSLSTTAKLDTSLVDRFRSEHADVYKVFPGPISLRR